MTTPKQKSLPVLIHELDAVFSRFIRLRDTKDGVIRCFICGAKLSFQEAQVMHFIDRDQMPTRYDEMNCHAGCEDCNCYDSSHHGRYSEKMRSTYGVDAVMDLAKKSLLFIYLLVHKIHHIRRLLLLYMARLLYQSALILSVLVCDRHSCLQQQNSRFQPLV